MSFDTICVVGLGYIGLPTAAVIASRGIRVIGLDVNAAAVATINRGETHIVEPDLDAVVRDAVADGTLRATTVAEPADAFMIAVPTPFKGDHEPDLAYIESAARAIAPVLKSGDLVILESTSPVGATEQMSAWLAEARPDLSFPQTAGEDSDIRVAHCPERVLPGHVLRELVENDRVIGGLTPRCSAAATSLYQAFVQGDCITTTARTAEMCKLTENSFRDVNIAFANELSVLCDQSDIDVWELIALANRHPRVNILQPGTGVGGHCIAVDPWFIVAAAPDTARIIRQARLVNDGKPHWVIDKVRAAVDRLSGGGRPVRIGCFGLAFKPDIDDLRESPSVEVVAELARLGLGELLVCEPYVDALPRALADSGATLVDVDAAMEADVLVFLTAHSDFRALDRDRLDAASVIDPCGVTRR